MKKLTFLILFTSLIKCCVVSAQLVDTLSDPELYLINNRRNSPIETDKEYVPKRLDTGLEVGTSFTLSPGNYYGPSYFIAPHINYRITPRSSVQAGIVYERSSFYPLYDTGNELEVLPMTRTFIYAKGSYMVTPRLMVGGTIYKSFNDVPRLNNYSAPYNFNTQGMGLNMEYKLSPAISFGFHMRVQNSSYEGLLPVYEYIP